MANLTAAPKKKKRKRGKKIACTINNQMGSFVMEQGKLKVFEVTYPRQIGIMWLFGFTAFILGLFLQNLVLTIIMAIIAAIIGYLFAFFKIRGKYVSGHNLDDIKSITCSRVEVVILFRNTNVLNCRMTPSSQEKLLNGVSAVLTNDYKRKIDLTEERLIVR